MARVNLSLSDELFERISSAAQEKGLSVGSLVVGILEEIYLSNPVNYKDLLDEVVGEAEKYPVGKPFALVELESFRDIMKMQVSGGEIKPSTVRARIGLLFNEAVAGGRVGGVVRHKTETGKLAFNRGRAALYVRVAERYGTLPSESDD